MRFGTLVHAVLATVDLLADDAAVTAAASLHGRLVGASDDEIEAAVLASCAALRHPLIVRAAAAAARNDLRREVPVVLREDDGSLVEGVVDLAFREVSESTSMWIVVDFKTDREIDGRRVAYEAQLDVYARAIRAATGLVCRSVLLAV